MPPVGLLGNGSSKALVLGVIAALRASAVSLNLLSAVVITFTGTPPANMTPGLYATYVGSGIITSSPVLMSARIARSIA